MTEPTHIHKVHLFKNHGSSIGYWSSCAYEDGTIITSHSKTLSGKEITRITHAEPKNVGKANETTPAQQAVLEIDAKARLKLDKGYVDSYVKAQAPATNALGLQRPMLATSFKKVKPEKIDWATAYAQPKLDGHRALWCPKTQQLYSRQGKVLENMHHIVKELKSHADFGSLHLDGELYIHGKPLEEISSYIKKLRPESLDVQYHIYDCISDSQFITRSGDLLEYFAELPDCLWPVATYEVWNEDDLLRMHAEFRSQGYEGTMLRFGTSGYQAGKRSRELLKLKEFHDAEFEVVGCIGGKETILNGYAAVPAVWVCKAPNGQLFQVLSQGTMLEKSEQYLTQHNYIGKHLTVKYHYLSKDGIPQLPIALRFREDI